MYNLSLVILWIGIAMNCYGLYKNDQTKQLLETAEELQSKLLLDLIKTLEKLEEEGTNNERLF